MYVKFSLVKSEDRKAFKKLCQNYFLEVVSSLCFGGQYAPEPALIKILMEVVFMEKDMDLSTRQITPLPDSKSDKVPVVRSSLLQLLLEHE